MNAMTFSFATTLVPRVIVTPEGGVASAAASFVGGGGGTLPSSDASGGGGGEKCSSTGPPVSNVGCGGPDDGEGELVVLTVERIDGERSSKKFQSLYVLAAARVDQRQEIERANVVRVAR